MAASRIIFSATILAALTVCIIERQFLQAALWALAVPTARLPSSSSAACALVTGYGTWYSAGNDSARNASVAYPPSNSRSGVRFSSVATISAAATRS